MAEVGALVYKFQADMSDLEKGFARLKSDLDKLKDSVAPVNDNLKKIGTETAKSVGLARHEMVNLSRQITDVGVSLISGQSPFMVLIQQGAQIADIFGSSKAGAAAAIKSFGASVASVVVSARFGLAGLAAAAAGIGIAAYQSEKSLESLSETAKALGSNRGSVKEFNRQLGILGVDPDKANAEMVALAQKIREAQIAGGDLADKLAKIGINIGQFDLSKPGQFAQLFQQIAEKVRNGSNELDKLNAIKLLGLSNEFMRVFNDGTNALEGLARSSEGIAEKTTKPVEKAWERLRKYWSDTVKYITDAAVSIADSIAVAVVAAIDKISALIDLAKKKWAELKSALGMGSPFPQSYSGKTSDRPQELPPIDISGGKTDLSVLSTGKGKTASGGASARDQIGDYIKNLREANQLAQAEVDTFALGNVEKEKSAALIKAENIAREQGRSLTVAQRNEILQLSGNTQGYKESLEQLKSTQNALNDAMRQFGDFAANAMSDLITRSKKASDVLRDLVKMLASSALKGLLTGDGFMGQLMGLAGKGGQTGGLIGSAVGMLSKGFAGLFAEGGSIPPGQWGIAGEKGPEAIVGPASVIPMGKGGNAAKVTVNNYSSAQVEARQLSDGEIVVLVQNAINANNRRIPGIMADAQRRAI